MMVRPGLIRKKITILQLKENPGGERVELSYHGSVGCIADDDKLCYLLCQRIIRISPARL